MPGFFYKYTYSYFFVYNAHLNNYFFVEKKHLLIIEIHIQNETMDNVT